MNMEENFLPLDVSELAEPTGNLYKSVALAGRRANQLTLDLKDELTRNLAEFAPAHDNLDEITENREQIEISKYYASDIVKDRDRMIDAQVQEIMVRKPTSKVLLPTNVVILSSTFTCNGNLAVHKYTLFIICRC